MSSARGDSVRLLSHVASMPQRVPPRLRPDRKSVRLPPDRNSVRQFSGRCVEHVHLVVVAPRYPELLTVRSNVTHVGTPTAGNWPGRNYLVRRWIQYADRARSMPPARNRIPAAIRHVKILPVPARIDSVRADARRNETNPLELLRVDHEDAVLLHVGDVKLAAIRR